MGCEQKKVETPGLDYAESVATYNIMHACRYDLFVCPELTGFSKKRC